jgi:glycosyltransferase involved in cell wall biosynthesis
LAQLHILMVTARFFPEMGGIETHTYEVSRRLVSQGFRVTVLTTDRSRQHPEQEIVEGAEIIRVPSWPRKRDYYVAPDIYKRILSSTADVIHVQGYHTFVPPVAMAAALRRRLPFVLTFHSGGHSSLLRNTLRWPQHNVLTPLVRRAVHLIGVSQFEADFFSRRMGVSRQSFSVIRNGASMPLVAVASPETEAAPLIISVGRLERYKGHHRLISALPHLISEKPDVQVLILGDGPYKSELMALAARLGVAGCVTIKGVPPSDRTGMAKLVTRAALVVLLSDYEAHPVAVMEALALKRRVLVADGSGLQELVDHDAVECVDRRAKPQQIAHAIMVQLAKGPLQTVTALPSWDDCAERLGSVYQQVVRCESSDRQRLSI